MFNIKICIDTFIVVKSDVLHPHCFCPVQFVAIMPNENCLIGRHTQLLQSSPVDPWIRFLDAQSLDETTESHTSPKPPFSNHFNLTWTGIGGIRDNTQQIPLSLQSTECLRHAIEELDIVVIFIHVLSSLAFVRVIHAIEPENGSPVFVLSNSALKGLIP